MAETEKLLILKGAHVIDPDQGIDRVTDVTIANGRIRSIGDAAPAPGAEMLDLSGQYLTPGWIDLHVHVYGALGFVDADSIGIRQGVTSFVDAGGPGIDTLDECCALFENQTDTRFYLGPLLTPFGLVGFNYQEGDARDLGDLSIAKWLDFVQKHPGLLRYLKINAHGYGSAGLIRIGKGLGEIVGLPLYFHIGEFQNTTPEHPLADDAFRIAQAGDMITHIYHKNLGHIIGDDGKVLPVVKDAARRGVIFDIGFGGYNFAWDIAEKAVADGVLPDVISSDLQQFNVTGPVYSLANVMSVCMRLGLSLSEVIDRVTARPAKALSLTDRAGSLRPGLPADVTVFRLEEGEFELTDAFRQPRKANARFAPTMAFKDGVRYDCDFNRCLDERNWFMQVAEDHLPASAERLSPAQIDFLASLSAKLTAFEWKVTSTQLDLWKARELQAAFHEVRQLHALPLREALTAVYDSFLDNRFTMQIGLFLMRLDRGFALQRLNDVTGRRSLAA
ncbi:MAG TPA: amidohydrolase family protein [Alphaproteobacteria bacterium]